MIRALIALAALCAVAGNAQAKTRHDTAQAGGAKQGLAPRHTIAVGYDNVKGKRGGAKKGLTPRYTIAVGYDHVKGKQGGPKRGPTPRPTEGRAYSPTPDSK